MLRSVVLKACRRWIFLLAALLPTIAATAQAAEDLADSASRRLAGLRGVAVDDAQAAAAGIHKLSSRRLTLYTDCPLTTKFAACRRSSTRRFPSGALFASYRPRARRLADDRLHHQGQGPFSIDGPAAGRPAAFSARLLAEQPTLALRAAQRLLSPPPLAARRRARLHEHPFGRLRPAGGTWKAWPNCWPPIGSPGRLTLNWMPGHREDVPEWGRIRIIKDACRGPSAHVVGRRRQLSSPAYLVTSLRLVLGPGGDVGPRSALPRPLSANSIASSPDGDVNARNSAGSSSRTGGK